MGLIRNSFEVRCPRISFMHLFAKIGFILSIEIIKKIGEMTWKIKRNHNEYELSTPLLTRLEVKSVNGLQNCPDQELS